MLNQAISKKWPVQVQGQVQSQVPKDSTTNSVKKQKLSYFLVITPILMMIIEFATGKNICKIILQFILFLYIQYKYETYTCMDLMKETRKVCITGLKNLIMLLGFLCLVSILLIIIYVALTIPLSNKKTAFDIILKIIFSK